MTYPAALIPAIYLCFVLLGVMIFTKVDDTFLESAPLYARIMLLIAICTISLGICALIMA